MILNKKNTFQFDPLTIAGLIILLLTAHFSEGFYRGDEHYQLLEFAHYILGKTPADQLCWEYHSQLRPSVQAYFAASVIYLLEFIQVKSPFIHAEALRIITAILSFTIITLSIKEFSKIVRPPVLTVLYFLLWFMVYICVRFSSETWSGLFFMLAFHLWFRWKEKTVIQLLIIGVFAGFSFQFRYQTAIMSLGFLTWLQFIKKENFKNILIVLLGFIAITIFCIGLDSIFYKQFELAPYNYFYVNLIENKVASFGVSPWYHYLTDLLNKTYFIYGLMLLLGIALFVWKSPKNVINFTVLPFILFHFAVGHKEMRFLFPVIFFVPLYIGYAFEFISKIKWINKSICYFFILSNSILLLCTIFYTANSTVQLRHWMHKNASKNDVIYVIEDNPYNTGLPFNFYNTPKDPIVKRIEDPKEIILLEGKNTYLYVSNRKKYQKYAIPSNSALLFQSLPRTFTEILNINGWADRTTCARFYKIIK